MRRSNGYLHRYFRRTVGVSMSSLALVAMMVPSVVHAQDAKDKKAKATGKVVEEVIVTARRKSENLERVPISVAALGQQQLEEKQVKTDADLQIAVPGLTIRETQGNNSLTYSIRGQSADTFSGSPSAVVAYIDEVPLTISGASTFYDLQSIQVLKGPQGTLFGRNTTGGAVLYTTAKPTNDTEGMLKLRAGNYNMREAQGMANAPLVDDTLLLRVAFDAIKRDGYIYDVYNDKKLGDIGQKSGRVTLAFKPNDQFANTTMYSYSRTDGTNTGASYVYSVYAPGQTHNGYALNASAAYVYPDLLTYVKTQKTLGYYKTSHPYGAIHIGQDEEFVNTTTFDVNDNMRLKNIFGYTAANNRSEEPSLGAPDVTFATRNIATGMVGNRLENESFSDEFQVSGEALDNNLNYISGIYFQHQRTDTLWPQTYFSGAVTATNNFRINTKTAAIYGQATYSLTSALRATVGLRYTKEDVSILQLSQSDFYQVTGFNQKQDDSFKKPSWNLGLDYDLSDSLFTYIKTRGSFRSGGFNGSAPPIDRYATGGGNKFKAETVKDVEAGLKYRGDALGLPATMNLAVYQEWVKNVQRIEFPSPPAGLIPGNPPSIAVTANVPEMKVRGVELEGTLMVVDWLELGASGTYTDAIFTDGNVNLFGVQYSYSPVANTPRTTWSLWGQVYFPLNPAWGELRMRTELYGQDQMYFSNTADSITPETELPSYVLVNARLEWNGIMGSHFSAALFGKNLTNEHYFVGGMPLGASLGHNAAVVGEPRMYGAEATYKF